MTWLSKPQTLVTWNNRLVEISLSWMLPLQWRKEFSLCRMISLSMYMNMLSPQWILTTTQLKKKSPRIEILLLPNSYSKNRLKKLKKAIQKSITTKISRTELSSLRTPHWPSMENTMSSKSQIIGDRSMVFSPSQSEATWSQNLKTKKWKLRTFLTFQRLTFNS